MDAPARTGEYLRTIRGVALARLFLAVVSGGAALLAPPLQADVLDLILSALAVSAATNALLFVVPLRLGALKALAHALLLADTALVTFLVYLTGWAGSPFLPLTFATALAAAFLLGRAWAVVYASAMVLALCAVTGFYRSAALAGVPPPLLPQEAVALWKRPLAYYLGHLLLETAALYAVALLSGLLVVRLSREQVLVREVLDMMGEGVLAVDARGRLIVANAEAQRCLRLPEARPGEPLAAALSPDVAAWLLPALAAEAPLQITQTLVPSVGPTLPLAVQVAPLSESRGRRGTVVLVTDLTREREAAAAGRRAERLESTARLAMGIAHEIRNPLASIRGAAQELARAPDERLSAMILRESDRLDRILGDFLAYARLGPPRPGRCDLGLVLSETLEAARSREDAWGIAWRQALPPGLVVPGDPEQLRQLFLNLLINAVQALRGRGSVAATAGWATRGGSRWARVLVADDGPGIPREERGKIFEPFHTTKAEGTGLGLALAARVAAAHGGELRLAEAGAGACFEVWLPEGRPDGGEGEGTRG